MRTTIAKFTAAAALTGFAVFAGAGVASAHVCHPHGGFTVGGDASSQTGDAGAVGGDASSMTGNAGAVGGDATAYGEGVAAAVGGDAESMCGAAFAVGGDAMSGSGDGAAVGGDFNG
ncbi:hypothetical protein [Kitasatospora sp. McL0602]|uniref:hypothetical protein n=1 Tax=Kitasatospora sp. McL0602 TaxID=3439530 RepID=UPI003F8BA4B4